MFIIIKTAIYKTLSHYSYWIPVSVILYVQSIVIYQDTSEEVIVLIELQRSLSQK